MRRDLIRRARIDFDEVNRAARESLPALCQRWLPNGRRVGAEWIVGSLRGERGQSLRVRLSGSKAGVWRDFAEGHRWLRSGQPDRRRLRAPPIGGGAAAGRDAGSRGLSRWIAPAHRFRR
jgi:hypothetical protein